MEFSLYFYNTEILKLQIRHLWIFVIFRYERPGNQPMAFGGAIGVADSAGGDDGMGDLCVGGSLPPALFRGRHVRQEIELALAVDQDRDQRLAVLGEQDAFSPFLGAQPDPEREADRPIARDDAAVVIDHEDRTIGRRPIGERFRDLVVAIEDRFDGVSSGLFSCSG